MQAARQCSYAALPPPPRLPYYCGKPMPKHDQHVKNKKRSCVHIQSFSACQFERQDLGATTRCGPRLPESWQLSALFVAVIRPRVKSQMAVGQNTGPQIEAWQGLKPAVPWWLNFDSKMGGEFTYPKMVPLAAIHQNGRRKEPGGQTPASRSIRSENQNR